MPSLPFEFSGASNYRLVGRIEKPIGCAKAWALFAHCFTCGKDNIAAVRIARALAGMDIGTVRFDFAGLGESGGGFADGSFGADVRDLIAAAGAMANANMGPSLLIGHSLGGAAALAAAAEMPSIRAVATIGAPFDVAHVLHQFDPASLNKIEQSGVAQVRLAGRPFLVGKRFIDDLRSHDQGGRIAALRRPLLILHAPRDEVVGIDNATQIFTAARHPKSFVSLDDADHLLTQRRDADYVASIIATWASRYLPASAASDLSASEVEAEETGAGKFQLMVEAGGIRFLADEPQNVGGLGSGPTPYQLLSAALAACTTMTLRLYADHKGWPVTRIRTTVAHARQKDGSPADVFARRLAIEGSLDAEQRARMLQIANRCPVHKTLEQGASFTVTVDDQLPSAEPAEAHCEDMKQVTANDT